MDPNSHPCSLSFELKLIKARNIEPKNPHQEIFVRCYLPIGNDKRARVESKAIPLHYSNSLTWDQTFSLQGLGTQDTIKRLEQKAITFELRCRSYVPTCMGRIGKGSELVGRAEVPWNEIAEEGNVKMEKWVVMLPKNGWVNHGDVKPPAVQMGMKVVKESIPEKEWNMAMKKKEGISERRLDGESCGCKTCVAYEFFAIEAALEAV